MESVVNSETLLAETMAVRKAIVRESNLKEQEAKGSKGVFERARRNRLRAQKGALITGGGFMSETGSGI